MHQINEIVQTIREYNNFVLAGHISPDGDSIGSCFALALALKQMGKQADVVLEPIPRKYSIIPGTEFLYKGELSELKPDVFIAMDCASPLRLGAAQELFNRSPITLCIDHHETNPGFAMYNYIEPAASSTGEMVFFIIEKLTTLCQQMAAALYAAMVNDTGGFRFSATAKSTMETVGKLMETGIPFTEIYNEIMHRHRFVAGKALGIALLNSKRTTNKKIVYSYITREMLKSVRASIGDLDGVAEYLMDTNGAKAVIFAYEKSASSGEVKINLRSNGPNMARVAAELGGGGHAMSAGASATGKIGAVLRKALKLVKAEVAEYEK